MAKFESTCVDWEKKRERKMKGNHFAIIIVLCITSWYLHVAFLFEEMLSASDRIFKSANELSFCIWWNYPDITNESIYLILSLFICFCLNVTEILVKPDE